MNNLATQFLYKKNRFIQAYICFLNENENNSCTLLYADAEMQF